ncbi:MAG: hypothetical protein ACNA76_05150 [Anaerosomatales bacterium]
MPDTHRASSVLRQVRGELLERPNVVATGVGFKETDGVRTGEIGIVCSVEQKVPAAELTAAQLVPRSVDGVVTDVVATGPLRALSAHLERHRPAPGGVSIGHRDITAGTLGCTVRRGQALYILSNNHVLADVNRAQPGDPILQPGPYDGGRLPDDAIAVLETFVPIHLLEEESGCGTARAVTSLLNGVSRLLGSGARLKAVSARAVENLVDAALALPLDESWLAPEILGVGRVRGVARVELGMRLRKSGRTTGVTSGEVVQVDVTADVRMGERTARFADQFMAGAMSQGGDSGSLVVDGEDRAVGLLFAGSDTTTICNRIEHVLAALEVELWTGDVT